MPHAAHRFIDMKLKRGKIRTVEEGLLFLSTSVFSSSTDGYFLFPVADETYILMRRHKLNDAELRVEDGGPSFCPHGEYAERCCPHKQCREYSVDSIEDSAFSCAALQCIYSLDRFSFIAGVYKDASGQANGQLLEGSFSADRHLDAYLL